MCEGLPGAPLPDDVGGAPDPSEVLAAASAADQASREAVAAYKHVDTTIATLTGRLATLEATLDKLVPMLARLAPQ